MTPAIELLLSTAATVLRDVIERLLGGQRTCIVHEVVPKSLRTLAIGAIDGNVVGMTSVASRSRRVAAGDGGAPRAEP